MLESYIDEIIMLSLVQLLGVVSPGPDFAIVVRNSLLSGRRAGIFTALGITLGASIHVTWAIFGLGTIIKQTPVILRVIQLVGAGYLLYLGVRGLMVKKAEAPNSPVEDMENNKSSRSAFMNGLMTNLLNAKAILFIVSVLSAVIDPNTPNYIFAGYFVLIIVITQGWFSTVCFVLTQPAIRKRFLAKQHWIERSMGAIMILLALKVVLGL